MPLSDVIGFILHIDKYFSSIIQQFGTATYLILILIVFAETGFVATPFLPGDSLLFVAGAFSAQGVLNPVFLFLLLSIAAILGDSVNYSIGKAMGKRVFHETNPLINRKYLLHAEAFYEKYGAKTIVLARFVPIVRTFAPFVAGIGKMNYATFISYNIVGAIAWVGIFVFGGYFFGNIPLIKENFGVVTIIIIILSFVPIIHELIKHRRMKHKSEQSIQEMKQ